MLFRNLHYFPARPFSRRLHNLFRKDIDPHHHHTHQPSHQHQATHQPLHQATHQPLHQATHQPPKLDPKLIKPGITGDNLLETDEFFIKSYQKLIEGNHLFVKEKISEDPNYFKTLSKSQHPNYFVITCSDSRVPPNELTKSGAGELFVHRNIANQCKRSDLNCQSALFYAVEVLKVSHVIVLGHTHCGGIAAAAKNQSLGIVDLWLQNVRDIAVSHKDELARIKDEHHFLDKLSELNCKHQVLNVCKSAVVQKAWAEKRKLRVSGWMFDIETGLIKDVDVAQKEWEGMKKFFNFSFHNEH